MSRLPPISSLIMSPPEGDPLPSFQSFDEKLSKMQQSATTPTSMPHDRPGTPTKSKDDPARRPPSPPESPATAHPQRRDARVASQSSLSKEIDPVLYPKDSPSEQRQGSSSLANAPLFPETQSTTAIDDAIRQHLFDHARHYIKGKSKGDRRTLRYQMPSVDEYRLALSFVEHLGQEPQVSLKRVRDEDIENYPNAKRLGVHPRPSAAQPKTPARLPLAASPKEKALKQATPTQRKPTTPRVRAIPRAAPGEGGRHAATTAHTRVREPKKPIDTNWRAIPDYAPSTDILGDNPKALKVDWDGNPLDLSNDPDREQLHEAELHLASALRLSCPRYLTCKRRIFTARVEALKIGKEFKKTDAQQACQIDVNKASKLWMAYEKVGWLQPQLFKQYL